jgi:Flp pilus assembly pilin Flp
MRYYIIGTYLLRGRPILRPPGNRKGQTLVEYALVLAIVSVVAVSVMIAMTGQVKVAFTTIDQQIAVAGNGGPAAPSPPSHGGG